MCITEQAILVRYVEHLYAAMTSDAGQGFATEPSGLARRAQTLSTIYTPLESETAEGQEARERYLSPGTGLLSAIDAMPWSLLLGRFGEGKTFFCRFVASCLAGERLRSEHLNIGRLQEPLVSAKPREQTAERSAQSWSHGTLVPIYFSFRDADPGEVAAWMFDGGPESVWVSIISSAAAQAGLDSKPLLDALESEGGLVFLEDVDCLARLDPALPADVLSGLAALLPHCRFVATADRGAWLGGAVAFPVGFQITLLSYLHTEQILAFAARHAKANPNGAGVSPTLGPLLEEDQRLARFLSNPLQLTLWLDAAFSEVPNTSSLTALWGSANRSPTHPVTLLVERSRKPAAELDEPSAVTRSQDLAAWKPSYLPEFTNDCLDTGNPRLAIAAGAWTEGFAQAEQYLHSWSPDLLARWRRQLTEAIQSLTLPAVLRIAAGRLLANIGDERPGIGVGPGDLPDIDWRFVPGGSFDMGLDPDDTEIVIPAEIPRHRLEEESFFVSRYPVTQAQFACFVRSDGYRDESLWPEAKAHGFWSEAGIQGRFDLRPRRSPANCGWPYDLPNHPVVGVNWYDALAFTRWLTRALRTQGRLAPPQSIELPTEPQWERAARPADDAFYPWAGDYDQDLTNCWSTFIASTSPVGCFPRGAGRNGVSDLSGNVFEWCSTIWGGPHVWDSDLKYPYRREDREELSNPDTRVLRGGSFRYESWYVRVTSRARSYPDYWRRDRGFRVVLNGGT